MLIRTEAPADILAVERLLHLAFTTTEPAKLVQQVRENSHRTLSLVACDEQGELVGYVLFSPVTLNGEDRNWQALALLTVAKDYRDQGIASQLIHEGLASLGELGYPVCVVLTDTDYYQDFGFVDAARYGVTISPASSDKLQLVALWEEALTDCHGLVEYSPEFTRHIIGESIYSLAT